jgi:hypothetical protein
VTQDPRGFEPHDVEWVATPPGGAQPRRRRRPPRRYTGPPSYPAVPRWGFPLLAWRWPLALPNRTTADPVERAAVLGSNAVSTLWITAGVAALATFAEAWRYVLLVRSLGEALPKTTLAVSDALVSTAGVMTWLLGVLAATLVVLWTLRARAAAAERIDVRSARSDLQFIAGVLVPGLNLFVPGSVLAELEHSILVAEGTRERGTRPKPSRLVVVWWAAWVASLLLGWIALVWSLRSGVQAMADGVLLHMWNDLAVVVLAIATVQVIKYFTRLLTPVDLTDVRPMRVLEVHDAPRPPRAERPSDAPR